MSQKISFILPCLNEQEGIKIVLTEIIEVSQKNNLDFEIIISDNNSGDDSILIARQIIQELWYTDRLKIVIEKQKGYWVTYRTGFENASGDIFIMADSDGTYDFHSVPEFLSKINAGYEFVIWNRFSWHIEESAMPFLNRYIGNPILSGLVRILFHIKVKDIHSGMRCITKNAYHKLNLYTHGMEFASEMIIQAGKNNLKTTEIDIPYRVRIGTSKLERLQDGWRHLQFILLYSPYYLFFLPGVFLFTVWFLLNILLYFGNLRVGYFVLQTHPMFFFLLQL